MKVQEKGVRCVLRVGCSLPYFGHCLWTTCFFLYGEDIVKVQAYADDLIILVRETSEKDISSILQEVLNGMLGWCER